MKNIEIDFLANNEGFIKEIAGYWSREWSESFDELSIQKKAEKIKKQVSRNELPVVFVAKDGNQLLGTAALLISDLEDRPELSPWLADVYVLKEFRRQGVATRLVNEAVCFAKKKGIPRLYLFTEYASRLYEELGWAFLEETVRTKNGNRIKIYYLDL